MQTTVCQKIPDKTSAIESPARSRKKAAAWILASEVASVGGLQYNARILEIRAAGWEVESKVERVRVGARSHIKRSWFRLLTQRQSVAFRIGMGQPVSDGERARAQEDDTQPSPFS